MRRYRHVFLALLLLSLSLHTIGQDSVKGLLGSGKKLNYEGYYDSAAGVLRKAMSLAEGNRALRIRIQYEIGDSFLNLGKCDSAELMIKEGLELVSNNDSLLADGYQKLSRAVGGCSRKWQEAIDLLHQSMKIKERIYGKNSIELSHDYTLMGYLNNYYRRYDSSFFYLKKALDIQKVKTTSDPDDLAKTYFYLSNAYERVDDLKSALNYAHLSLNIRREHLRSYHPSISNVISNLGNIYKILGNYDLALNYMMEGLEMRKISLGETHGNVAASYYNIGTLHGSVFNYRRAIPYINQGNLIVRKIYGDNLPVLFTYYAYLGQMYYKSDQIDKAEEIFAQTENLTEAHTPENHVHRAYIYLQLAEFKSYLKDYDSQQAYIQKALRIYRLNDGTTTNEAAVLWDLGEIASKKAEYKEAERLYNESLNIYHEHLGEKSPRIAAIHRSMGLLKQSQNQYQEALEMYNKSLNALIEDSFQEGQELEIQTISNKQEAIRTISCIMKAYHLMNSDSLDVTLLKKALSYGSKAMNLIDIIAEDYKLDDSRIQLAKDTRGIFDLSIKTAFELYKATSEEEYKKMVYAIVEKSKSPVLLAKLTEHSSTSFSGVPDSLLTKERDMRIELTYFKEKLRSSKISGEEEKIDRYQESFFNVSQSYETFKEELKSRFPEYYDYKYINAIATIDDVQRKLPTDAKLLSYYFGNEFIYVLDVTSSGFEVEKMPVSENLLLTMGEYRRSLTDHRFIINSPKVSDSLFISTGFQLYAQLVDPYLESAMSVEKLLIIPDGLLSSLNFGTFLSERVKSEEIDYGDLSYLLNSYSISYANSATLYVKEFRKANNLRFGGFAPSYKPATYQGIDSAKHLMAYQLLRDGELPLPGAIDEVKKVSNLLGGDLWLNTNASENNMKKYAKDYGILHLAMHSLLNAEDPEYSELLFNSEEDSIEDGYLTINEIYNLDLNAAMVVLSACSSGEGKLMVGEGPISFSRAFSYAGCPSVITSMWKLPDESTNQIIIEFYKNLKEGDHKDEALRKAQLTYLQETDDPLYRHPFFWGSFVVLGDVQPISGNGFPTKLIYLGIGLLLIGAIFYLRKKQA